jgi:diguanylate cyclase (GGDEF)-like protein
MNGRRRILVVDDEIINRELLKKTLEDEYDVLMAPDGEKAHAIVRENRDNLSLILLDLLMPGMHGFQVMEELKKDEELGRIPIIVLTSDEEAEVQSLKLGAMDFITKPHPKREVIRARIRRTIELYENTQIIQYTERDTLTGLYNRAFFYRYCRQFDQYQKNLEMDAVLVNVNRFHLINERYGKAYGDDVLRRIGSRMKALTAEIGGIACRREADTFLIYCPHQTDYQPVLDGISVELSVDRSGSNAVRVRMGVYANADKTIEVERRFDRAKIAADTARSNYMSSYALYDRTLHEKVIYEERLLEDFETALRERQFVVHYQPKFDIRPETPVLASAEALVRWIHPELGFISPGSFIPLFEENGLIQQLDLYVWRETASQITQWKTTHGKAVPVSVNVSRIDMYDPELINTFQTLLEDHRLSPEELLLEITESAYTQDSAQIISKVKKLRDLGFHIEMDDFGTGYSSLNMISRLPIDALKLDMTFIRDAFQTGGDTRLVEMIIDIADYLHVPVIAEGVETEEQLSTLRALGCDLVQGYYFSKPVPPEEFERFFQ